MAGRFLSNVIMNTRSLLQYCLFTIIVGIPCALCSQSIVFKYDDAGNRLSRTVSVPELMKRRMKTSVPNEPSGLSLFDTQIKIGPSPTSGVIKIEIAGLDEKKDFTAYIFNASSQLVLKQKIAGLVTELDITSRPNGVYIVGVVSGDNCVSSKIVKQ